MTFYTYLIKHKNEESSTGGLARDVYPDDRKDTFKFSNFNARELMRSYLESRGPCSECLSAFGECYEE